MGCACLAKNVEIKSKDLNIDLSGEQTKSTKNELTTYINTFSREESTDIFEVQKRKLNINNKPKKQLNKLISHSIESKKISDQVLSGPIITLLKSRVEKYQRLKNNQ